MVYFQKKYQDKIIDEHSRLDVPGGLEEDYAKRAPTAFEKLSEYNLKLILENCVPDMNVKEL